MPRDLHPYRTRALILAERLTLTRPERQELAAMVVGHEGSWSRLTEPDARRLADALHAYAAVQWLLHQRAEVVAAQRARARRPA